MDNHDSANCISVDLANYEAFRSKDVSPIEQTFAGFQFVVVGKNSVNHFTSIQPSEQEWNPQATSTAVTSALILERVWTQIRTLL